MHDEIAWRCGRIRGALHVGRFTNEVFVRGEVGVAGKMMQEKVVGAKVDTDKFRVDVRVGRCERRSDVKNKEVGGKVCERKRGV